ncbi:hypothetical protein QBC43DRAFT_335376 [Cladorrhinum sp. PSN259]|nr:hypothetical protein QBC43DRAFT_335376 [Cladorrhinum sp. PSN259]
MQLKQATREQPVKEGVAILGNASDQPTWMMTERCAAHGRHPSSSCGEPGTQTHWGSWADGAQIITKIADIIVFAKSGHERAASIFLQLDCGHGKFREYAGFQVDARSTATRYYYPGSLYPRDLCDMNESCRFCSGLGRFRDGRTTSTWELEMLDEVDSCGAPGQIRFGKPRERSESQKPGRAGTEATLARRHPMHSLTTSRHPLARVTVTSIDTKPPLDEIGFEPSVRIVRNCQPSLHLSLLHFRAYNGMWVVPGRLALDQLFLHRTTAGTFPPPLPPYSELLPPQILGQRAAEGGSKRAGEGW